MTLNQNQFAQLPVQGQLDLQGFAQNVVSCQISKNETATLVAGSPVKMEDTAGGLPKVLLATADTDAIFGFISRNPKDASFVAGDRVEVAIMGSAMYMTAGAAITRGAPVVADVSEAKVLIAAGTVLPVCGIALDKAAANNDLIRVLVLTPQNLVNGYFADLIIGDDVLVTDDFSVGGDLSVTGTGTFGGNLILENGQIIDNSVDGTVQITSNILKLAYDAAAYMTITQADGGGVTIASVSDGTPGFTFSQAVAMSATLAVTGEVTLSANLIKSHTDYSAGAGALPLTTDIIFLTTGGAEALTLADGVAGQTLKIIMVVDGGDGTLTPANFGNGTTITFDDAGDSVELVFDGTNWWTVGTPTATVA